MKSLIDPFIVQTGLVEEAYESILVKVYNANCTDANYPEDHFMWSIDDGTGTLKVHNSSTYEYNPVEGTAYNVTGPMKWDFGEWKIELRFASDVTDGTDTDGPTVVEVIPVINTNIKVQYNEAVETTSAENLANYAINNGITIESASQHDFNKSEVYLTISPLSGDYELTVENVEDTFGNVMEPQTIPFSYVGIKELLFEGKVSVYPNPASEQLNILFTSQEEFAIDVTIVDLNGKELLSENHFVKQGENRLSYNLKRFGQGIYFLHLRGEQGVLSYKLVVK